jgi:hypothetical protein
MDLLFGFEKPSGPMSYTFTKVGVKEDVYAQIDQYKEGTKKEQALALKIEKLANQVKCFQCLDTRQAWSIRDPIDEKGDYYKMSCAVCPDESVKDRWIEDSLTNEMYGVSGYRLFHKRNYSGAERFKEIEKKVLSLEPTYQKTEKNNVRVKKVTTDLKVEVGNIVNKCKEVVEAHGGNVFALSSLIRSIEMNISSCEQETHQDQVFCEEMEDRYIYVKVENHTTLKKVSMIGVFSYNQYDLDIDIHFYVLKPENEAAIEQCKTIVNQIARKDMIDIYDILSIV